MKCLNARNYFILVGSLIAALSLPALGQSFAGVLTWHNDNARSGLNQQETILTTANVKVSTFGKLFSDPIEGQAYAQPLYVPNVSISGQGTHNVVYVATEHDQLYAFDADTAGQPLWHISFIDPAKGITTVSTTRSGCPSLQPEAGISATPVIDTASGTLYVTVETREKGKVVQRLHALDIATGAEKFSGPVVIQATVNGIAFDPTEIQRVGLLLLNGTVYFAHASLCNPHPYHGWLFGYNAQNLQQQPVVFNTTPDGDKGGIWQSGAGLASDGKSIYFMDGDGTFDAHTGGSDYGMSMLRMNVGSGSLTVADYFTPYDWSTRSSKDLDLGSGGVLLLPKQSGSHPDEIIGADKSGDIFLIDRNHMGKYHAKYDDVVQRLNGSKTGYWSSPANWQQNIYYDGDFDYLSMYSISNGLLSTSPISQSAIKFKQCTPSISSNGASNGIVWVLQVHPTTSPAILYAYDAANLSTELYDSNQAPKNRDVPGDGVKFTLPTIANGKVYIATQTELNAYGLLQ